MISPSMPCQMAFSYPAKKITLDKPKVKLTSIRIYCIQQGKLKLRQNLINSNKWLPLQERTCLKNASTVNAGF